MKTILITGGTGYIGSHISISLIKQGITPILFDNFENSSSDMVDKIEKITAVKVSLVNGNINDQLLIEKTLEKYNCDAVIHLAAIKFLNPTSKNSISYYENNIRGSISLIKAMENKQVKKLIFSSSAAVYGDPNKLPLTEEESLKPKSTYGYTKHVIERILNEIRISDQSWKIAILRYFNVAGNHSSGIIGENSSNNQCSLLSLIARVALKKDPYLNIWGQNYPTNDGTGCRDYIHVTDVADAHIKALSVLEKEKFIIANLGTGEKNTVLEVIDLFEKITKTKIPYKLKPKRDEDIAISYCDPIYGNNTLGWKAQKDLKLICEDIWRYES